MIPGLRLPTFLAAALAAVLALLTLGTPPAEAGRYYEWYCRTASVGSAVPRIPNAHINYDHPIVSVDDWDPTGSKNDNYGHPADGIDPETQKQIFTEANAISSNIRNFANAGDGDHPGVQSAVLVPNTGPGEPQIDISSNTHDRWNHTNACASSGYFEITGTGVNGQDWTVDPEATAIWRWRAPEGDPFDDEDSGYWWGQFEYSDRRGNYGADNHNYNGLIVVRVNNPVLLGYEGAFVYDTHASSDHTTLSNWTNKRWDMGNAVSALELDPDVPMIDDRRLNLNDTAGMPAREFAARLSCNHHTAFWNDNFDPPGPHATGCPQSGQSTLPVLRMRNVLLYVQDDEPPMIEIANSGLFGNNWNSGSAQFSFDAFDGTSGIDNLGITVRRPNNGPVLGQLPISGKTGTQPCYLGGVPGPPQRTTSRAANRVSEGALSMYSPSLVSAYDGSRMRWRTGPCPHYVTVEQYTVDTTQAPFKEGSNEMVIQADDFHIPNDQDNNGYPLSAQNGWDNQMTESAIAYIDNVPPIVDQMGISAASGGQVATHNGNTYARGNISLSGTARDDRRGPDGIQGTADDPDVQGGQPVISGIHAMGLWLYEGANGSYVHQQIVNRPSDQQGQVSRTYSTTSHCDGAALRFSALATDNAGHTSQGPERVIRPDNRAPLHTTPEPESGRYYSSYTVTPSANDAQTNGCGGTWSGSGVDRVEWLKIDQSRTTASACSSNGGSWRSAGQGIASPGACVIQSGQGASGSQTVTINNNDHAVYVRGIDRVGNVANWRLIDPLIDNQPPHLDIPAADKRPDWAYGHNQSQTVRHRAWDAETGIMRIRLSYSQPTAQSIRNFDCSGEGLCGLGTTLAQAWGGSNGQTHTYDDEGVYRVQALAYDWANNQVSDDYVVRVDKTAPDLKITSPSPNYKIRATTELRADSDDSWPGGVPVMDGEGPSTPDIGWFEICSLESTTCAADDAAAWQRINQPGGANACTAPDGEGGGTPLTPNSSGVATDYSCRFDPIDYPAGSYMLRFVGRDVAGNEARSPAIPVRLQSEFCPL